jgi:glyceraldehyde 3-phosphate dehydrogenase
MTKKIAINGFGRIGRAAYKNIIENHKESLEVVAINDLLEPEKIKHLLKYDSIYGIFDLPINPSVRITAEREPENLPWSELGVDVVLECTGLFTNYEKAEKHISAGAKKVIISAPSKEPEKIPSFVLGVNEEKYDSGNHHVVDMGSCTTNCLAPILKVIDENFKVVSGMMTTIHSYTISQNLLDGAHKDYRRSRAAALNIIPTTTGAAKAVSRVLPSMEGKITGMAMRIPTATVSVVDLVCVVEKETTKEEVLNALKKESEKYNNILKIEDLPLVSSDFIKSPYSSIVDSEILEVNGKMIKVLSWYDNEWGYSSRLADFAKYIGERI